MHSSVNDHPFRHPSRAYANPLIAAVLEGCVILSPAMVKDQSFNLPLELTRPIGVWQTVMVCPLPARCSQFTSHYWLGRVRINTFDWSRRRSEVDTG
jgi:hypothetical protein